MYESRTQPPLSWPRFLRRLLLHGAAALALIVCSLLVGVGGHVYFEEQTWHQAFLNSAVMLGGLGVAEIPRTLPGRVFAGLYALYAGLVFVAAAGTILAPVVHRLLHTFHWRGDAD